MKTIFLFILGISLEVSAQNAPFVFKHERKTNTITVKAEGVISAHTVTTVGEIAYVAVATDKGIVPFDQPAGRIVSVTTNLIDKAQVQKPLLSAQKAQRPAPKIKGTDAPTEKIVTAVPPNVNTNSPSFRKANKLPPYNK